MLNLKLIPPTSGRSKFYRVRGTDPRTGRRIDRTTRATTERAAKEIVEQLQRDILNGVLGRASRTFRQAAIAYVKARKPTGSQLAAIIGAEKEDSTHTACLIDWFGDSDCRGINQDAVQVVIDEHFRKTRHGRPYADGTIVRQLFQPLTAVLNYGAIQNPPWCEKPQFVRPKFNDARSEYTIPEEAARILRAASPTNRKWYLFMMLVGSRPSETLDLEWRDVWFDRQWAVLRDTKNNQEDRGIALHPQVIEMLSRIPQKERVGKVFKTSRGLPYAEADGGRGYKTGWKATTRRAGISRALHVHDLRHTFGTLGLVSGMPRRMIEEQMGHADTSMFARYVHVPRPELIESVHKLPWLDYQDTSHREWAQSGFGSCSAAIPNEVEKVPGEPAAAA